MMKRKISSILSALALAIALTMAPQSAVLADDSDDLDVDSFGVLGDSDSEDAAILRLDDAEDSDSEDSDSEDSDSEDSDSEDSDSGDFDSEDSDGDLHDSDSEDDSDEDAEETPGDDT